MAVSTAPNSFMAQVRADVASILLGEQGLTVQYRKVGGSAFGEVIAYVGPAMASRTGMSGQRLNAFGAGAGKTALMHGQATSATHRVTVAGKADGELVDSSSGVTASSGIEKLSVGDTFKIPAFAVGGTGSGLVELRVGPNIEAVAGGAYWKGDIA